MGNLAPNTSNLFSGAQGVNNSTGGMFGGMTTQASNMGSAPTQTSGSGNLFGQPTNPGFGGTAQQNTNTFGGSSSGFG